MVSVGPVAKRQIVNLEMIILATENVSKGEIEMVKDEMQKLTALENYYKNMRKHIQIFIDKLVKKHGKNRVEASFYQEIWIKSFISNIA